MSDIGSHCSECRQLDFLPFTCAKCKLVFCLDHRNKHACMESKKDTWMKRFCVVESRVFPGISFLRSDVRKALKGISDAVSLQIDVAREQPRIGFYFKSSIPDNASEEILAALKSVVPDATEDDFFTQSLSVDK